MRVRGSDPQIDLLHPASFTLFGEIKAGLAQHPLIAALPQMVEGGVEGAQQDGADPQFDQSYRCVLRMPELQG